jgi:MATE family multidrug resistance protein
MPTWIKELRPTMALAVPIMVGQVSQMLMGILDSVMVGRVGAVPLAGAAFVGAVFTVFFVGCIGLLQPGAVLVAREHGAGRDELCGLWLRHARWLAWVAGAGLGAVMLGLLLVKDHFGQPAEVVAIMGPYFAIIAVSLVPTLLFQADRQFAEALGRPWAPLGIMLGCVALNAALNWVFIYGKLGFPAWGLTGAGVATLVARVVSVLVLRAWLERVPEFRVAMAEARRPGVEAARMRELLALGLPMGAALFFETAAFSAAAVMAGWLGTVALAAHQIVISCAGLTFMVPLGVALALSVRVSKAVGAGQREGVRPMAVGATLVVVATAAVMTLGYVVWGGRIAALFVADAAVVALAGRVFVVVVFFQLFDGLQVVFAGALRGLTDVRVPTLVAFAVYWGVALPLGFFWGVQGSGGLMAIWIALAAGLALAAILLGARLRWMTR